MGELEKTEIKPEPKDLKERLKLINPYLKLERQNFKMPTSMA